MAKFSAESKLGDLLKDPEAKAVLVEFWPDAANPKLKMLAGTMTLKAVAGNPRAKLSKETLDAMDAKLQAIA